MQFKTGQMVTLLHSHPTLIGIVSGKQYKIPVKLLEVNMNKRIEDYINECTDLKVEIHQLKYQIEKLNWSIELLRQCDDSSTKVISDLCDELNTFKV